MTPTPQKPGFLKRATVKALAALQQMTTKVDALPIKLQGHQRNYAAAQVNRLTQGWTTVSGSANSDIHRSLDAVRARSRKLANDDEYVKKWLSMVTTNVVGPSGFRFQARVYDKPGSPDTYANDAIEAAWAKFSKKGVCDVTGRQSLTGLQQLAIKAVARDGEFLIQIVRGSAAANPYGIALQILDVDRLATTLNKPAEAGANAIRMGVEVNAYGRPVAYHLKTNHPGELYQATSGVRGDQYQRVSAADIIHEFVADRPEQVRGMPWAHAAMIRLNNLGGYEEAAVIAARVGASKMGFFTTPDGQAEVVSTGSEDGTADGALTMDADPGVFQSLPEGVQFQPFNPDYPTAMYADFVKANLRGIASGLGVAYHALANDLEGVSFSSIRSGTLEERDVWMLIQEWFAQSFLDRVHAEFMQAALAFGQITLPNGSTLPLAKLDKFTPHTWQGRRWEWVDPLKDIEADIAAINAGLKSPQSVAAKLGLDYEDLLIEIKAAETMRTTLGIKLASEAAAAAQAAGQAAAETAATAGAAQAAKADQASKDMALQLTELRSMVTSLATRGSAPAAPAPQPPAIINVTLPEQRHEHHTHIQAPEAPNVEVRNEVTIPETVVNVEAIMPQQERQAVQPINIQVQPADVVVNNTHPSRAVQTVQRDAGDEIISTTTTYEP
jgi:lambda family phage portal protein